MVVSAVMYFWRAAICACRENVSSGVVGVLVSKWAVALISVSGRETEIQLLYEKAASCFVY